MLRGFVERKTLFACILATGAIFIDISIVNVVLPDIRNDLHTSLAQEQWIVNAYLITMTAFVLPAGVMGDVWGHKRMLRVGLAAFVVATLLVGLAPTADFLIGARALQGLAAALMTPASIAILRTSIAPERQARAIEPPPPPPWTVAPRFEAFVATCEAETAGLHLAVPGWRMDPIACTPTPGGVEVVAVWHPDGGRLPELLATFRAHGLADPAISAEAGQLQAIQRRAVALAPRPSDTAEMPLDPAAIEARLRARFDTLALAYALEARGPLGTLREAPLPGGPAAFAFHELALGSSIAPQAFVRLLSDMPALVADSYVWDPANLSWSLVVRIYHPLPSG